jgi:Mg2+ and Co2+ transporter CorA
MNIPLEITPPGQGMDLGTTIFLSVFVICTVFITTIIKSKR